MSYVGHAERRRARYRAASRARERRRRRLLPAAFCAFVITLLTAAVEVGHLPAAGQRVAARTANFAVAQLSVTTAPWSLPAPVSGASLVTAAGAMYMLGGLDSSGGSATGVFRIDQSSGSVTQAGNLAAPTHDAAGVYLGGRVLLFGGGDQTVSAAVEGFTPGSAPSVVGALPSPRADLAAVTVGDRAYVVGGYDGANLSPDVLSTADGARYQAVAELPVPVRYPAVVAVGNSLYVFGGEAAGGDTATIQRVDIDSGTARVVGQLPAGISHAAAVAFDGRMYVLGGQTNGLATDQILSYRPGEGSAVPAGQLPQPVANAAIGQLANTAYLVGGQGSGGTKLASVAVARLVQGGAASAAPTSAAGAQPFTGRLLIADRGNNRLLLVNAAKQVLWTYPSPAAPAPPGGFYFPDDAFFIHGGQAIISNEEDNNAIVEIAFPSGQLQYSYGHARVAGSAPGYLSQPDDAYLMASGQIAVADAQNCRIEIIDPAGSTSQLGTTGACVHDPPRALAYPNGDTPLSDGNLLISEVNGSYIDEVTLNGNLVWSLHLPITYPSDPQQLGPDLYLVADYARPGGLIEFNREGQILWTYRPSTGPGMLDHPSLAEQLPNGLLAVNDDYRHRVVIIDPHSEQIVWQYGLTDTPGTGPGELNTPDGFDLLDPSNNTPTHPNTG